MPKLKYQNISRSAYQKIKFFRHLRAYIAVNSMMFMLVLFTGGGFGWMPIILLWGIGIVFHYLRAFGWPGTGMFSEEWERKLIEKEDGPFEKLEDFGKSPQKVNEKRWDEEDIV